MAPPLSDHITNKSCLFCGNHMAINWLGVHINSSDDNLLAGLKFMENCLFIDEW